MSNSININLGELELDVEVEYEVDAYDKGDWTTPPSGPAVYIKAVWMGKGHSRINILDALDSLSLGLEDTVMEQLAFEDLEQEPDADHAMELARDREMGL